MKINSEGIDDDTPSWMLNFYPLELLGFGITQKTELCICILLVYMVKSMRMFSEILNCGATPRPMDWDPGLNRKMRRCEHQLLSSAS